MKVVKPPYYAVKPRDYLGRLLPEEGEPVPDVMGVDTANIATFKDHMISNHLDQG